MNRTKKLLLAVLAAAVMAGCSSGVKLDDSAAGAPVESRGSDTFGVDSRSVAPVTVDGRDPLNDPASPLANRSIYFDFDSFAIREEFRSVVDAHANYLNTRRERRVLIQGNTDDRGSREYNLALGQKRAEAVRRALATLGVSDNQMEAVSLGEERPRSTEASEAGWAENRRADLVYQ